MTLRNLTSAEMMWVTRHMVSADGLRAHFEAHPLLAAQLGGIEHAHAQVAASAKVVDSDAAKELAALSAEGVDLDVNHHDRLVRGIFFTLQGAVELTPTKADDYAALSARLLPLGLATGQQSWKGEAGNVERVEGELASDKELREQLKAFVLPNKRTLFDVVQEFVRAGKRLGAIELRRNELNAPAAPDADVVTVAGARNEWVATINALCTTLRLPRSGIDAVTRDRILAHVGDAEKQADQRSRRAAGREQRGDAPEPAPTPPMPDATP